MEYTFIMPAVNKLAPMSPSTHPNAVPIYDMGEDNGVHWFSMEYVCGESLAEIVKRQGRLEAKQAASHVLQAARALKHAHDHGLVHGDVKPGNLLLANDCLVRVADLGLARIPPPRRECAPRPHRSGNPAAAPCCPRAARRCLS